jgi:hypothetical protein
MGFMISRELKEVPHDLLTHDQLIQALIEGKANRYIEREKAAMIKSPNPQAMSVRLTDLLDPNKPQFEGLTLRVRERLVNSGYVAKMKRESSCLLHPKSLVHTLGYMR